MNFANEKFSLQFRRCRDDLTTIRKFKIERELCSQIKQTFTWQPTYFCGTTQEFLLQPIQKNVPTRLSVPVVSKSEYLSSEISIKYDLRFQCKNRCLDGIDLEVMQLLRKDLWSEHQDIKEWVVNYLVNNIVVDERGADYR